MKTINVSDLPKAGPYSHAVISKDSIYLSGQTGDGESFREQFMNTMKKIIKILEESGSYLNKVCKVTVYLSKAEYFQEMNDLYGKYFKNEFPARTTVIVNFPNSKTLVEIDVIAEK
ncbi:MAG: RidA family protein [Thermoplasmata archaeon]|nr:RidA family protein [Thermoplasmata archaeon]